MDEIRSFMAERLPPFRLKGLRAIFLLPDYDVNEDKVGLLLPPCFPICLHCTRVKCLTSK